MAAWRQRLWQKLKALRGGRGCNSGRLNVEKRRKRKKREKGGDSAHHGHSLVSLQEAMRRATDWWPWWVKSEVERQPDGWFDGYVSGHRTSVVGHTSETSLPPPNVLPTSIFFRVPFAISVQHVAATTNKR